MLVRTHILLLALAVFLLTSSIGRWIPIVPILIQDSGVSIIFVGIATSGFNIAKLLSQYPGGLLAGKFGSKWAFMLGVFLAMLGSIGIGFSTGIAASFLWLLTGAGYGLALPSAFELANSTAVGGKGSAIGLVSGAVSGGLALGSISVSLVDPRRSEGQLLSYVLLASAMLVSLTIRESLSRSNDQKAIGAGGYDFPLIVLSSLAFYGSLLVTIVTVIMPLHGRTMGFSAAQVSTLMGVNFGAFALAAPFVGKTSDFLKPRTQAILGLIGLLLFAAILPFIRNYGLAFALFVAEGFCGAAMGVSARQLLGERYEGQAAKAFGVFGTFGDAGGILGPVLLVSLLEISGPTSVFLALIVTGTLLAIALLQTPRNKPAVIPETK